MYIVGKTRPKRMSIKQRYVRAMLDSYFPFLCFIFIFIAIFVYAAMSIRVATLQTYSGSIQSDAAGMHVRVDAGLEDSFDHIYVYNEKNVKVLRLDKIAMQHIGTSTEITVAQSSDLDGFLSQSPSPNKSLKVEVPQGTISLMDKILLAGEHRK